MVISGSQALLSLTAASGDVSRIQAAAVAGGSGGCVHGKCHA
jgi:hypothetical protein